MRKGNVVLRELPRPRCPARADNASKLRFSGAVGLRTPFSGPGAIGRRARTTGRSQGKGREVRAPPPRRRLVAEGCTSGGTGPAP